MNKNERGLLLLIFLGILIFIIVSFNTSLPENQSAKIVLISTLVMLSLVTFFLEHFFTKPTDVLASTISIILLLAPLNDQLNNLGIWYDFFLIYNILLFCTSLMALFLLTKNESSKSTKNIWSKRFKEFSTLFGKGKLLFFALFILTLLFYVDNQSWAFLSLFFYSALILFIEPKKHTINFFIEKDTAPEEVGEILSVESGNIFLAKIYPDQNTHIDKFEFLMFTHTIQGNEKTFLGLVVDSTLLDEEKWIKILQLEEIKVNSNLSANRIYQTDRDKGEDYENFVGLVTSGSDIETIKFEYSPKVGSLEDGDLVTLDIDGRNVFYQIINGVVKSENLEERNKRGYVEAVAIQLGVWDKDLGAFDKFGWVPNINTPVNRFYRDFDLPETSENEFELGFIPKTDIPSVLDLKEAVTHHTAILGITGSGKSFIAREIIAKLKRDTKVICIDFTGEYVDKLSALDPELLVDKEGLDATEELYAKYKDADSKRAGNQETLKLKNQIDEKLLGYITDFMDSEDNLSIFELPDLSNTSFILKFTQQFLESIFKYAKKNDDERICIVIEEAHTVVPETNSLGDFGDYSSNKALVNKIGQIALQGRKYDVGFFVIAQRTANVSKTVLTQCNTIISFQAHDKTSFGFLENYFGSDMINAIPTLKRYHAVVSGKAIKSKLPMIIDLKRETSQDQEE
ncbi:ATP-binding protein [Halalkalibaculum sp. DA384]|uniref:ATP-binding protein n=1 Tax=Halalkalibaculum sp. DA384 TaxID=3373606 RepID=UPI00375486C3